MNLITSTIAKHLNDIPEASSSLGKLTENLDLNMQDDLNMPIDKFNNQSNEFTANETSELNSQNKLSELAKDYDQLPDDILDAPIDKLPTYAKDAPEGGLNTQASQGLKEATGWPDSIIDNIRTIDESDIYQDANLEVTQINGKDCLTRTDVDYTQKDEFGRTNLERMNYGLAALDKEGIAIELHHVGQHSNSSLAELRQEEHRGTHNDLILHDKTAESQIDREAFGNERRNHWRARAEQVDLNK